MGLYVILSLLLASSFAKKEQPCCVPDKWEGYLESSTLFNTAEAYSDLVTASETLAFDFDGKRIAANYSATYQKSRQKVHLRILQNFSTMKTYTVEESVCHVTPLSGDMSHCLPDNSTMSSGHSIGAMGSALHVVNWIWNTTDEPSVQTAVATVDNCIPYGMLQTMTSVDVSYNVWGSYNRITEGIKDEAVFNTPPECRSLKIYPNAKMLPQYIQNAYLLHGWFLK